MSSLWTPGGEQPPNEPTPDTSPSEEELAAARDELERVRDELARTPVRDIVLNHAVGLWQLAILHLGLDRPGAEANLAEAKFAIDAMASLVDGVVDRLGEHREPLQDALTNLRIAFVRLSEDRAPDEEGQDGDGQDDDSAR